MASKANLLVHSEHPSLALQKAGSASRKTSTHQTLKALNKGPTALSQDGLHQFHQHIGQVQEAVNRLNFMMSEIYSVLEYPLKKSGSN